jgi:hypothetical protein
MRGWAPRTAAAGGAYVPSRTRYKKSEFVIMYEAAKITVTAGKRRKTQ